MRKKLNRSQLTKKLDRIFSKYIRLRDSRSGMCTCITCSTLKDYKEMHAGHFIRRGCRTTRWDEKNVHAQCPRCNTYCYGEQAKYLIELEKRYGREEVDELMRKERKYDSSSYVKTTNPELREMIEFYKNKIKEYEYYK